MNEVATFTAGAVGVPGQRTFFLQARADEQVVSIKCEKQQVDALSGYLRRLLDDLPDAPGLTHPSLLDLQQPIVAEFVVGSIGVAYDGENDRIVLQFDEVNDVDEDDIPLVTADSLGSLRVRVTRAQAASFCDHATALVTSGRPPCRFCGEPLDPRGHACVRMN
jgi:uncharacterized repeat protein (TIGR03847 family)